MGLDMSIKLKRRVSRGKVKDKPLIRYYYNEKGEEVGFDLPNNEGTFVNHLKLMRKASYAEDVVELAYWRKANAIHKWFVDHIQDGNDDCGEYRLYESNLLDLYDLVTLCLEHCELKEGTIRNGYMVKKFLWFNYRKFNKTKGIVLSRESRKYCKKHLPTQEGFFFGSTDYNEIYYNDLVYTKERLEYILDNYDVDEAEIYYSSSW